MNTKTIIFSLFAFLLFIGCQDEPQYSRFEDHNVAACGVADPLNNLPWLKAYCIEHHDYYSAIISIYKNNLTDENHITITDGQRNSPGATPQVLYRSLIYSCDGVLITFSASEGPRPAEYDRFFDENMLVAKIWSVQEIIKN